MKMGMFSLTPQQSLTNILMKNIKQNSKNIDVHTADLVRIMSGNVVTVAQFYSVTDDILQVFKFKSSIRFLAAGRLRRRSPRNQNWSPPPVFYPMLASFAITALV